MGTMLCALPLHWMHAVAHATMMPSGIARVMTLSVRQPCVMRRLLSVTLSAHPVVHQSQPRPPWSSVALARLRAPLVEPSQPRRVLMAGPPPPPPALLLPPLPPPPLLRRISLLSRSLPQLS